MAYHAGFYETVTMLNSMGWPGRIVLDNVYEYEYMLSDANGVQLAIVTKNNITYAAVNGTIAACPKKFFKTWETFVPLTLSIPVDNHQLSFLAESLTFMKNNAYREWKGFPDGRKIRIRYTPFGRLYGLR